MRIDDNFAASTDLRSLQVERTPETEQQQRVREQSERTAGDSVSLSALGAAASQGLSEESPAEIQRVEQTRLAVEAGNFNVPPQETAEALIEEALTETSEERGRAAAAGPPSPL